MSGIKRLRMKVVSLKTQIADSEDMKANVALLPQNMKPIEVATMCQQGFVEELEHIISMLSEYQEKQLDAQRALQVLLAEDSTCAENRSKAAATLRKFLFE